MPGSMAGQCKLTLLLRSFLLRYAPQQAQTLAFPASAQWKLEQAQILRWMEAMVHRGPRASLPGMQQMCSGTDPV